MHHDFVPLRFELMPDVLSMNDVLAQVPQPREALRKAAQVLAPGGVLIVSTPDIASSGWKLLESAKANPYWTDLERYHVFSREQLMALIAEAGFSVAHFTTGRVPAQMEIYAVRNATT
jgi:2-polyprenyl-3-methyl-5-hydroxy-6-metoxy-1,4-benzoquinol methylase